VGIRNNLTGQIPVPWWAWAILIWIFLQLLRTSEITK
jgi:hypothetical protein